MGASETTWSKVEAAASELRESVRAEGPTAPGGHVRPIGVLLEALEAHGRAVPHAASDGAKQARAAERLVYAEPIREQGPKTYPAMRARVEAAAELEGVASAGPSTHARAVEPVPPFGPRPIADVLGALTGRRADETLPAGVAPLAVPVMADVENDGDRGPRALTARERLIADARTLPDEWISVASWMLSRLPTLRADVQRLTLAESEPVDRYATSKATSTLIPTPVEHVALASTWRAVLDVSRLIEPRRDMRRGGAQ